jgi:hypothetical protein
MFWRWRRTSTAPFRPTFSFAPIGNEIDRFLGLLLASGIAHFSELWDVCSDFDFHRNDSNALADLCTHLIAKQVVTAWQCDKLKSGKWKGFYLDGYKLLGPTNSEEPAGPKFLAVDVTTGQQVTLVVKRLKAPPWLEYSVLLDQNE